MLRLIYSPKIFFAGLAARIGAGNKETARSSTGMAETGLTSTPFTEASMTNAPNRAVALRNQCRLFGGAL